MTQVLEAPRERRRRVAAHPAVPARARPSQARAAAAALVFGAAAPRPVIEEPHREEEGHRDDGAPRPDIGASGPVVDAGQPDDEAPRQRRHLRVVETPSISPAQRRRRSRILVLAGAGLLAVIALVLVYLHVLLAQRQFSIDQLNTEVQTQRANYDRLRLQVAELSSPQHVVSVAVGQLKMQQPASVTYLTPTTRIGSPVTNTQTTSTVPTSSSGRKPVTTTPPAGDADWPQIKPQLAGNP